MFLAHFAKVPFFASMKNGYFANPNFKAPRQPILAAAACSRGGQIIKAPRCYALYSKIIKSTVRRALQAAFGCFSGGFGALVLPCVRKFCTAHRRSMIF